MLKYERTNDQKIIRLVQQKLDGISAIKENKMREHAIKSSKIRMKHLNLFNNPHDLQKELTGYGKEDIPRYSMSMPKATMHRQRTPREQYPKPEFNPREEYGESWNAQLISSSSLAPTYENKDDN
jgi:hypothetical protein